MLSLNFLIISLLSTVLFCGCLTQESRLESMLDRQIGKSRIMEKTRLELDSMLGKNDSRLKDSLFDFIQDRTRVEYTEVVVDGKRARVKVLATVPKLDELNTLILLSGFIPREKLLRMSVDELVLEISKRTRKPASEAVRSETYEFFVDFEKQKNWMANPDQISNAFARRNLISQR